MFFLAKGVSIWFGSEDTKRCLNAAAEGLESTVTSVASPLDRIEKKRVARVHVLSSFMVRAVAQLGERLLGISKRSLVQLRPARFASFLYKSEAFFILKRGGLQKFRFSVLL